MCLRKKYKMTPVHLNHLNNYVIVKNLGCGGFSNVKLYRCRDINDDNSKCNKLFVVKKVIKKRINIFYKDKKEYEESKKYFIKEYNIMKNLDHENIIKCLDISSEDDKLIFEYFPAIDLFDYLGKFYSKNTTSLMFFMKQVIDAIDYLHDLGISHMDIKQENILLDLKSNKIKLIDFGCSCYFKYNGKSIKRTDYRGTKSCFSPEMFNDIPYNPEKCDIWSLGVLLYNLVYNKFTPWEYAIYKDVIFNECEKYFDIYHLHPMYFDDLTKYGFNKQDAEIIYKIFKYAFQVEPERRRGIKIIKKEFNKLSIL